MCDFFHIEWLIISNIFKKTGLKFLPGKFRNSFSRWNNIFQEESVCHLAANKFSHLAAPLPKNIDLFRLQDILKGILHPKL